MNLDAATIIVNGVELPVLTYREQRVITTEMLAKFYGTAEERIRQNYARNEDRFEAGKHYFKLEGSELASLRVSFSDSQNASKMRFLMLWTKRGAARHAKVLDTDQAWEVFDALEDAYFNPRRAAPPYQDDEPEVPYDRLDPVLMRELRLSGNKALVQGYCVVKGLTPEYLNRILNQHGIPTLLKAPDGDDPQAAPLELLAAEVPMNYDRQDDLHWYLLRETFTRICGDYDVTATGRMLAARGLLSRGQDSLTKRLNAKTWGFGEHGKISFFAIRKRLAQFATTPASPDRPQPNQDGRNGL